jgi:hypothetical protein
MLRGQAGGLPLGRAAPPKAGPTSMIKASARKRAKTARERAEPPIMRPYRPMIAARCISRSLAGPSRAARNDLHRSCTRCRLTRPVDGVREARRGASAQTGCVRATSSPRLCLLAAPRAHRAGPGLPALLARGAAEAPGSRVAQRSRSDAEGALDLGGAAPHTARRHRRPRGLAALLRARGHEGHNHRGSAPRPTRPGGRRWSPR